MNDLTLLDIEPDANGRFHSVCPHDCPSQCPLEIERVDTRRIKRVYGASRSAYHAGVVCAKVGRYAERVHHPDRLKTPLRRIGEKGDRNGFEPMSWDDALDAVAQGLGDAISRHGGESVWAYDFAGTMGQVQRHGITRFRNDLKLARHLGSICTFLPDAGWAAGVGQKHGVNPLEMTESDLIVVWGGNPVNTQVHVMSQIAAARKNRGAKLVVVDPYRTGAAAQADMHLMVRPGTDGALACAIMHVLFKEDLADRDYLRDLTDFTPDVERHFESKTPEWAEEICGVPAAQIVEFARLWGATKRAFLRCGYGFARSRNGAAQMHAVTCLPAVTGAWRHRGGGALYGNAGMYKLDRTLLDGADLADPSLRALDMTQIGRILTGDRDALGDGPPIFALFVQNTNPVSVAPESLRVREGFARDDLFVCVHEQFMTDTAAMADIVLPATMFLEHTDMYPGGGHTLLMLSKPVIEPYAQCRPNHWVLSQLAKRLGGTHRAWDMKEWDIIDETLRLSGLPGADEIWAKDKWLDQAIPFDEAHFLNGFGTPDKRFHFAPDWSRVGADAAIMPALPDHLDNIDKADAERPFRLVAAPARNYLNSTFTETPTSIKNEKRPTAKMHPDDLAKLGIEDGDPLRMGNHQAEITLHAAAFEGLLPGVVIVESIWPNTAFEKEQGVNALTSADPGPPNGGGVFHDTAVWIKPAT
jgi:anaerobic selenocysteine-containing dehydrogenase